jgi:nucleoside-diphosphate-sugar epimerase
MKIVVMGGSGLIGKKLVTRCSNLIISGRRLDYIARVQLAFGENSRAFRLTLSENTLGLDENSLITSDAAWIH